MHVPFNRLFAFALALVLIRSTALADIFQWQWADPADHSLGKTQSNILCPDGAGRNAQADLGAIDLTQAYLYSYDLSWYSWFGTNVNNAYFGKANLYQMLLYGCSLRSADFTAVQGMGHFRFCDLTGADFTDAKLKHLSFDTLDDANFTRADLSNASFEQGTLRAANFTDANITGTQFIGVTGFTSEQLHQTGSYKSKNLRGVGFTGGMDLSGWDFSGGLDLTLASCAAAKAIGARFNDATLTSANFLNADVSSADFSGAKLQYSSFEAGTARNTSFKDADLSNASLFSTDVRGADFTDAIIAVTNLEYTTLNGFDAAQLYSTANYQAGALRNIDFSNNDMSGWSFRGIDLSGTTLQFNRLVAADFSNAKLGGTNFGNTRLHRADFSGTAFSNTWLGSSDLRGASNADFTGAMMDGAIMPDGTVDGLGSGAFLAVVNYRGGPAIPIRIKQDVAQPFRIRFLFDDAPWQSTVAFDPGIPVDITDTSLNLMFDDGVDPSALFGDTFRLFDWAGVDPIGEFDLSYYSAYAWDLSHLYTDGTVTLIGVPEPSWMMLFFGAVLVHRFQRRLRSR